MNLLLDESVPWDLRVLLPGHEVWTARYMGWDGKSNGELLSLARDGFDVLITVDRNIPYQHNLTDTDLAVVVLAARTNGINDLKPLVPELLELLRTVRRGSFTRIDDR